MKEFLLLDVPNNIHLLTFFQQALYSFKHLPIPGIRGIDECRHRCSTA